MTWSTQPLALALALPLPLPPRPATLCFSLWPAAKVAVWLEVNRTPPRVCAKLLAANVTGEQLLHVCELDLKQIGITDVRDQAWLLRRTEQLCKRHFAALRSSLPPPVAPPTTDGVAEVSQQANGQDEVRLKVRVRNNRASTVVTCTYQCALSSTRRCK
eukprot:TRINITY_DN2021_c5_g1_i6.p2 TRINITY_DN2021_c5_g1~~TRINITY_DN2021_c5_g1_i6.p2  ORF type:complete len:159 (+),score=30.21 TRINITY_DN2021_c5_g1_i6:104-580(+)